MSAVADPSPLASAATATLAGADWLEAAYFGAGLPREAEHELQLGAAAYHREEEAETHLRRDRKSTRLNSSHIQKSRMPSSA